MIVIFIIVIIFLVFWILDYDNKYIDLKYDYEVLKKLCDAKEETIRNLERKIDIYESEKVRKSVDNLRNTIKKKEN